MSSGSFGSYAWQMKGMTVSIPGWLELRDDRLCFTTAEGVVFDSALSDVSAVEFPWYYFGGGLKLHAEGTPYRLSFVKPNGAEYANARLLSDMGSPGSLLIVASKADDIATGTDAGRTWRKHLERTTASRG
jgi:hypothetical protein